jgi:hypothetical protein
MNAQPERPKLSLRQPADLLAVVPHLLGFTPDSSLVVLGLTLPGGRVHMALRYDLPDPPDAGLAADMADHAVSVLTSQHMTGAALLGYGPGPAVTPIVDAIRTAAAGAGVVLHDALRVEDGRYWSYLCTSPACCGPDGEAFDTQTHPVSQVMARIGPPVLPDRASLAATLAPATGPLARTMLRATRRAERTAIRLIHRDGPDALRQRGLTAVQQAITTYRAGGTLAPDARHAWLSLVLLQLPVRDDAWARMEPDHRDAHRRLWADLVRRAQPGYVAAPASLLAFTSWQAGEGALANIALDRALADDPEYSMARLIRAAVEGGLPPSKATLPMTPKEVAASYSASCDGDNPQPANN